LKSFTHYLKEDRVGDMFGYADKPSKVIKVDPPATREVTLTLYRGLDADMDSLEKRGDGYILSPHKSEQGAIWFSQYLDVARGRGEWIIKYPLKATKHYERRHKEDGDYYDVAPETGDDNPLENSKIYGGVELPEGWLWSYKTEKHIIATKPIVLTSDMFKKDSYYDDDEDI
tara:strand:+ start:734 stop:1249 length:516 start_codon:yes stop_codon:yes gene_type:complete